MDALTYIRHFTNSSSLWRRMEETVEDSPWHREDDVAVHTAMVLDQYEQRFAPHRTERQNTIARLALLFHDVGKPDAEETLEKKDGSGTHRRYAGHEQLSAVSFAECWLQDEHLRQVISADDARKVRFIIEHHLPYGYKDGKKRSDLRTAIEHTLREDVETFYDCLRSDAAGRISDDHQQKLQAVEDWVAAFQQVPLTVNKVNSQVGKCYVLIGPSGSGKSTWVKQHLREGDKVVSRDTYYLEYFHSQVSIGLASPSDDKRLYAAAWRLCCIDDKAGFEEFLRRKVAAVFHDLKVTHGSVFIDNTNGSKKARASCIQHARNAGMKVVAVEFWNTFQTVVGRQQTRPDKEVPVHSLSQQYHAQSSAWLGSEVDEVILVTPT